MSPCPTGWCGHPCTCESAYTHMDREEATALNKICIDRIRAINELEKSHLLDEPVKEFETVEVHVKALRFGGEVFKVDHLLSTIILKPGNQTISSLSGILTVIRNGDDIQFKRGCDDGNRNTVRWEILRYKDEVSVCIEGTGVISGAFATLTKSITYLPE